MSGAWKGSARRDGLPSWWPVTVRRIIKRDPTCRCKGCPKCLWPFEVPPAGCHRASAEVDHLGDNQNHSDSNLAGKCRPCHGLKSSQQGNEARAAKKRPSEFFDTKHPGDLT